LSAGDTSVDPPAEFQKYMLTPISVVGTSQEPTDQPTHGTGMLETLLGSMASNPNMVLRGRLWKRRKHQTYEVMEGIIAAINKGPIP